MNTVEKLDTIRRFLGISRSALSRAIYNSPNMFGHFKAGKTKGLSSDSLDKLFMKLGVSPIWWYYDKGPVFLDINDSVSYSNDFLDIPILGSIPAGIPAEAIEYAEETIAISRSLFRRGSRPLYALRVRGDSMIGAGIREGDVAIIEQVECWREEVRSRHIVAALIEGNATLKRMYRRGEEVILRAENPAYQDIILTGEETAAIRGKLVALVRVYRDDEAEKEVDGEE